MCEADQRRSGWLVELSRVGVFSLGMILCGNMGDPEHTMRHVPAAAIAGAMLALAVRAAAAAAMPALAAAAAAAAAKPDLGQPIISC